MVLYFAYGSNMLEWQMQERFLSADSVGTATLRNYRVRFNKYSSVDKSGKANVEPFEGGLVWGVLWEMDELDFKGLGFYEPGYDPVEMSVDQKGKRLRAFVFVAQARSVRKGLRPTKEYLDRIVEGAGETSIPMDYILDLERAGGRRPKPLLPR